MGPPSRACVASDGKAAPKPRPAAHGSITGVYSSGRAAEADACEGPSSAAAAAATESGDAAEEEGAGASGGGSSGGGSGGGSDGSARGGAAARGGLGARSADATTASGRGVGRGGGEAGAERACGWKPPPVGRARLLEHPLLPTPLRRSASRRSSESGGCGLAASTGRYASSCARNSFCRALRVAASSAPGVAAALLLAAFRVRRDEGGRLSRWGQEASAKSPTIGTTHRGAAARRESDPRCIAGCSASATLRRYAAHGLTLHLSLCGNVAERDDH
jgi:hypothetical protein